MILKCKAFPQITGLLLALMLAPSAMAGPIELSFKYLFDSGASLKGTLWGDLQADMNTISVADFDLSYNNILMPLPMAPLPGTQLASLDGSVMSLMGFGTDAVYPITMNFELSSNSNRAWATLTELTTEFPVERDSYNPRRLQLSVVPLPTSIALLGIGLLGLGFQRKSRIFML